MRAQLGRGWQIEAVKSVLYDMPEAGLERKFVRVRFGELGVNATHLTELLLWRRDVQPDSLHDANAHWVFAKVCTDEKFQRYIRSFDGALKRQDEWTLAWGIVKCAFLAIYRTDSTNESSSARIA
jgi:hypothetical protein